MCSHFTSVTYMLSFSPTSLEQFLRAIWGAVSQAAALILPQIKLNSQISRCAFFKFSNTTLNYLFLNFTINSCCSHYYFVFLLLWAFQLPTSSLLRKTPTRKLPSYHLFLPEGAAFLLGLCQKEPPAFPLAEINTVGWWGGGGDWGAGGGEEPRSDVSMWDGRGPWQKIQRPGSKPL